MNDLPLPVTLTNGLFEAEYFWRDNYEWFKSLGYVLRDRYKPDYTFFPFKDSPVPFEWENGNPTPISYFADATRVSDGAHIVIKRVDKTDNPTEEGVARVLGMGLARDPANHCIPIYGIHYPPGLPDEVVIVMPIARSYDDPDFDTFGEVVECFRQIFEGIDFMHRHNIAHRDSCHGNFMLDPYRMYPKGFSFVKPSKRRNWKGRAGFFINPKKASYHTRTRRPPRYWIVDFGLSRIYDLSAGPPIHGIARGRDRTVPEFSRRDLPANPFPIDVYTVGNWVRTWFIQKYFGFEFMEELVADMTHTQPWDRILMGEAFKRLEEIIGKLDTSKLRSRVVCRDEHPIMAVYRSAVHLKRRLAYTLNGSRRHSALAVTLTTNTRSSIDPRHS